MPDHSPDSNRRCLPGPQFFAPVAPAPQEPAVQHPNRSSLFRSGSLRVSRPTTSPDLPVSRPTSSQGQQRDRRITSAKISRTPPSSPDTGGSQLRLPSVGSRRSSKDSSIL